MTKRNSNISIYAAYGLLVITAVSLFVFQFDRNKALRLKVIQEQAQGDVQLLNMGGRLVSEMVNALQRSAEGYLRQYDALPPHENEVMKYLRPSEHFDGFALDDIPKDQRKQIIGNVNGNGSLREVDAEYERELQMAFSLNSQFRAVFDALPNAAWVYYVSKRGFKHTAPWRSTEDQHVSDLYLTREYYYRGKPEYNPNRQVFWTAPYLDSYGKGLMVSVAQPVYDDDEFIGTVVIDITLAGVSSIMRNRRVELGNSFVVMQDNTVLGRTTRHDSTSVELMTLDDVLPDHIDQNIDLEDISLTSGFQRIEGEHFMRIPLQGLPWEYVVHASSADLRWYLLSDMIPELAIAVFICVMIIGVEWLRRSRSEVHSAKTQLEDVSMKLSRYVSPQIYESVFTGQRDVVAATERKKLTVFFSDIQSFTETTAGIEPEDLAALLNDYLTEMTQIALEYGGTIDKYIGDAIMIFFGDPQTEGVDQDALKCVRMAVAMQERMISFRAKWSERGVGKPFHMRIGINTGYVNVGNFGSLDRLDYTIIGGEVNKAARLEAACEADGILLSHETWSLVKNEVEVKHRSNIHLKGFEKDVSAYQITDLIAKADERYVFEDREGMRLFVDVDRVAPEDRAAAIRKLEDAAKRLRKD